VLKDGTPMEIMTRERQMLDGAKKVGNTTAM